MIDFVKFVKLAKLEGKKYLIVDLGEKAQVYTTESLKEMAIVMGSALASVADAVYQVSCNKKHNRTDILHALVGTAVQVAEKKLKELDENRASA
jgi:hypothetical protein